MPIGVVFNVSSVLLGSLVGGLISKIIKPDVKASLITIFAVSAIAIGITSIIKLNSLPIVIVSLIIGALIGALIKFEEKMRGGVEKLLKLRNKTGVIDQEKIQGVLTIIMIFCFSGTGIFGALNEGMSGDSGILISKGILDFFTAIIFASVTGYIGVLIAVPQLIIFYCLYLLGNVLEPIATSAMLNNFVAVGGLLTLMLGINLLGKKEVKVLNAVFGLPIVFVLSHILI